MGNLVSEMKSLIETGDEASKAVTTAYQDLKKLMASIDKAIGTHAKGSNQRAVSQLRRYYAALQNVVADDPPKS